MIKKENPKEEFGSKKIPMSVISAPFLSELALAMYEGARKYGRHNYRTSNIKASTYYDACMRHLMAWFEGEDIDPDSGICHLTKVAACIAVIRDSMIQGKWIDDRPPRSELGWMCELNNKIVGINTKYPKSADPFTEIKLEEPSSKD